jgi:hypothetical protein
MTNRGPTGGVFDTRPTAGEPLSEADILDRRGGFDPLFENAATGDWQVRLTNPETGLPDYYNYIDLVNADILPAGLTPREIIGYYDSANTTLSNMYWGIGGGGGSGRRGSGAQGPVYVKPDERLVREAVKGTLAALAGKIDPQFLDDLTATYMSESKRGFDLRESEQIDPMETVKAKIRDTSEYKAIHTLRPESVDEMDWISSRTGALKRAGVTDAMAEDLGIAQATVGASEQDAAFAGNVATFSQSGKLLDELKERINVSTYSALRLI